MVEASALTNVLIKDNIESITVSSVLGKNHREYGKKHLYDGKQETCWNSEQGASQHISVTLKSQATLNEIRLVS